MKRKWLYGIAGLALILCAVALPLLLPSRPFRSLTAGELRSASVELLPPGQVLEIADTEELARLLQEVVVYRQDDSYDSYSAQAVIFTLQLTDGSQVEVTAYNPFLVIDGVGYRTKYGPCEALSRFANRLLP